MEDHCYKPRIKEKSPFTEIAIDVCVCICTRRCLITTQAQSDCSFLSIPPTPPHHWNSLCINVITRNIPESKSSCHSWTHGGPVRSYSASIFPLSWVSLFALFPSLPEACYRSAITFSMILLIIFSTETPSAGSTSELQENEVYLESCHFGEIFCFQLCKTAIIHTSTIIESIVSRSLFRLAVNCSGSQNALCFRENS